MELKFIFSGEDEKGDTHTGQLLTNKLATYIITEENPHECTLYGYIEIDEYVRVNPTTVKLLKI